MLKTRSLVLGLTGVAALAMAAGWTLQPDKSVKDRVKDAVKQPAEGMPGMDPKAMEAMMAAMSPGENHKILAQAVGEWDFVNSFKMDPSAPAMESKGSASITSLFDGRYIESNVTGDMMGQPFHGRGTNAYNNVAGRFEGTWIDSMGTGIMFGTGTYDKEKKQLSMSYEHFDPMAGGKAIKMREVTTHTDHDHMTSEFFMPGPDGKEFNAMTIKYTRKAGKSHEGGRPAGPARAVPAPKR